MMPSEPDRSDAADGSGAWEAQLAGAFEILLGRPLDAFDPKATYALYHEDDMLSYELFDYLESAAQLGTTVPGTALGGEDCPGSWGRWNLDLGRSVFMLGRIETPSPWADPVLRAATLDPAEVTVTGADLAPVSAGMEGLPGEVSLGLITRVETNGTLFDAMRAATWTAGGPADLMSDIDEVDEVTVDPDWERALAGVADSDLRQHLGMLCLDAQSARSEGAYYSGVDHCPAVLRLLTKWLGHEFVTGWEFGEGQASSAIFAIHEGRAPAA